MFCGNCGKQNPDGARFCSNCGSQLNAAPVQQTAPVYQAPPVRQQAPVQQTPPVQQAPVQKPAPAKKKSGAIGRILISIVAFFVASALATVLVQSFSSGPDIEDDGVTSAAYSQVFYDNGLAVPSSDYYGVDVKTTAYVLDGGNGMVENIEYAYDRGYIVSYVDTIYVPVAGMDEATKSEMDAYIQSSFSHLTYVSCCEITVEYGADFYVYRQVFTGLDKENNVRQLVGAGLVTASSEGEIKKIGIKQTEDGLLGSGYIKR